MLAQSLVLDGEEQRVAGAPEDVRERVPAGLGQRVERRRVRRPHQLPRLEHVAQQRVAGMSHGEGERRVRALGLAGGVEAETQKQQASGSPPAGVAAPPPRDTRQALAAARWRSAARRGVDGSLDRRAE
jgi:hypothetical protein